MNIEYNKYLFFFSLPLSPFALAKDLHAHAHMHIRRVGSVQQARIINSGTQNRCPLQTNNSYTGGCCHSNI